MAIKIAGSKHLIGLLICFQLLWGQSEQLLNPQGLSIKERFKTPAGYFRIKTSGNSFSAYLQNLPLKPAGSLVNYYNGQTKPNQNQAIYCGVVALPIGKKNLQQCADAVIRLRAEYLYQQQLYAKICFNFTNGFPVPFSKWLAGYRVKVQGNSCKWLDKQRKVNDFTYQNFWNYLELVFTYAGTISLKQELINKTEDQLNIGDVFIQAGSPGHAVIVADKAVHQHTGEIIFLLAQSYMPAQEIQILSNPKHEELSPWYVYKPEQIRLITPEWIFKYTDLKQFK